MARPVHGRGAFFCARTSSTGGTERRNFFLPFFPWIVLALSGTLPFGVRLALFYWSLVCGLLTFLSAERHRAGLRGGRAVGGDSS